MATILITGANRGIGLELTRQLIARGDHVVATCRTSSPALEATGARLEAGIDVSSEANVAQLASRLGELTIDTLILNAGVLSVESLEEMDFERVRHQLEVNAIGALRVVLALRPRLVRGSKIALLTSRMGSIADNTSGGFYGYRMSKAALNAAGVSLARDLAPEGIAVILLHPGFVRTEMTGGNGEIEPAQAAERLIARIDELEMSSTGTFRHANGEALRW